MGAFVAAASLAAIKRFGIDGPPEFDPAPGSLRGRTIVITGGNTGLGKESAIRLGRAGATVVITARTAEKGQRAVDEIRSVASGADVHFLVLDLADLESIRSFRPRYEAQPYGDHIDVLMNNAGVMAIPQRMVTKDGFERQLGVNHLGHFALTGLLLPLLERARGPARVVCLSSTAHLGATKELMQGDLMAPDRYTQWGAYCQSKLANVLFAKELDRRLKMVGARITAVSCHPGVVDTDLQRWVVVGEDDPARAKQLKESGAMGVLNQSVSRSVALGASTQVYLAAGADGGYESSGGAYFDNMAPGLENSLASDPTLARELWAASEKLTGVKFDLQPSSQSLQAPPSAGKQ